MATYNIQSHHTICVIWYMYVGYGSSIVTCEHTNMSVYIHKRHSLSHMNKKKTIKKNARKTSNNARDAGWFYALRSGMKIMCVFERSSAQCGYFFLMWVFVRMLCVRTHIQKSCKGYMNFIYMPGAACCKPFNMQTQTYTQTGIEDALVREALCYVFIHRTPCT